MARAAFLLACWFALDLSRPAMADSPPASPKKPVTDTYPAIRTVDDYRWLEDGRDPSVRQWAQAQTRFARTQLDRLPALAEVRQRLLNLNSATSPDYQALVYRGGKLFALKSQPPKNQPFLVTLQSADDPGAEHVIVDPNRLNAKGTTAIDFYVPSLDGRLVAVSLSEGGSEEGTIHIYEADTGRELPDVIPRVNGATAGGSIAWKGDGSGLYYTRYPRGNERPKADLDFFQQIYLHRLGMPTASDTYALGKDFPRIAEVQLETSLDGKYILASVANGDGGEFAHYLLGTSGRWSQLTRFSDQVIGARFGRHDDIYFLSRQAAPRGKVLRVSRETPSLDHAHTVVPEDPSAVIQGLAPAASRLYVVDLVGGPSQVRVFDLNGRPERSVPVPPVSAVGQVVRLEGDDILLRNESYTQPPAWYHYDPAADRMNRTALYRTSPADFSNVEVVREFVPSKDGSVKIPLTVIQTKGTKKDGNNPTLLYAYGGYGISLAPRFQVNLKAWLEQGCIYAVANLRGGGEYGEEWHKAGNLTHKQNVFDDFASCAQFLVAERYTTPARLAAEGGSNGGLLMGAALTQHPDLFRAVVSHVGIYDMLRVELSPNGAFNVTEFGTVKDPAQFQALYAYSPYHHVRDDVEYPEVLFLTGENDGRVDPMHSRKMTARLQQASKRPVLLRVSFSSGHGIGTALSERIAQQADVDAFLFHALGVTYHPVHANGHG